MNNDSIKEKMATVIKIMVAGFKSLQWLHDHECEKCYSGADELEAGTLDSTRPQDYVCEPAWKALVEIAQAEAAILAFEHASRILDERKAEKWSKGLDEDKGLRKI